MISFSVICRDRCDWSKKRVALPIKKSIARYIVRVFYDSLVGRNIFFVSATLIGQFDGILCIGIFDWSKP
jgi:hypothetical protein